MPDLDIDSLLAPLSGDAPCGADLEYDPAFQQMQEAAAGKPERQYEKLYPAEPPDWPAVRELALALGSPVRCRACNSCEDCSSATGSRSIRCSTPMMTTIRRPASLRWIR